METYQKYLNLGMNQKRETSQERKVADKLYKDADYRKQLLLRVLPDFEKLEQFDQLHKDFVSSANEEDQAAADAATEKSQPTSEKNQMAVSRGAA